MEKSLEHLNQMISKLEANVDTSKEGNVTVKCEKKEVPCEQKTCTKAPESKPEPVTKDTPAPTESSAPKDTPAPTEIAAPKDTPAPAESKKNQSKQNKKKKQKKKKPKKQKPRTPSLWEQLDFRVGNIVECTEHPESEKLYIEKIDLGEGEPRQILSGLQKVIPKNEMTGNVIVWVNLKPKKLGGYPSAGMVMCAQTKDKSQVVMLRPCSEAKIGDKVYLEDMEDYIFSEMENPPKDPEGNNLPLNFKLDQYLEEKTKNMNNSKRLKKVGAKLVTDDEGFNCFGKYKMRTKDGLLQNPKIPNGIIA
jgi:aminoacyl tRNA synthase complex-interacting multifunctional protein 1